VADHTTERQIGDAISAYLNGQLTQAAFRVRLDRLVSEDPDVIARLRASYGVAESEDEPAFHEAASILVHPDPPADRLKDQQPGCRTPPFEPEPFKTVAFPDAAQRLLDAGFKLKGEATIGRDCIACGEGQPEGECPKPHSRCGHHCNHLWTHDACCWCGLEVGEDGATVRP
jgi:hypothetical protein